MFQAEALAAIETNKIDVAVAAIAKWRELATTRVTRGLLQEFCQGRGNHLLWKQKYQQAAAIYDAGVAAYVEGDDTEMTANMLAESGFSHVQVNKLDEGEVRLERALAMHDAAKRDDGAANVIYYMSNLIFERGNIDRAVELAREAVKRSHDAGDVRGETFHAYALARALYEQGHSREADEVSRKAIPHADSLGLVAVEGNLVNMIANVALDDHQLDEAKRQYERAIELFREAGLVNHEAITISNLGNLAWDQGQLDEALANYAQAIKLHKKAKDERTTAIGLTSRAGVLTELGRFAEAEADLEQALGIMTRRGHERRISFVRAGFARLAEARDQLADARAHYAEAEMALETAGDLVEVGRMLYGFAGVEAELGDPETAEALIERAAMLDPASLSEGAAGEKRAGMDAVRALRDLALARIEAAKAKRASGEEARALRVSATARMQAIENAEDSLVDRSNEVRRVIGRLRAQLA